MTRERPGFRQAWCPEGHASSVSLTRRQALAVGFTVASLVLPSRQARAEGVALPVALVASLLSKVMTYDRNFGQRAGERARVLLVVKSGNADSRVAATQLATVLSHLSTLGGLPHEELTRTFDSPAGVAALCRSERICVAIFGPGFDEDVPAIARAFDGQNVLTATTVPEYVPRGIVLGFAAIAGKPKLLVQLTQARKQNVSFEPGALNLMQVYR